MPREIVGKFQPCLQFYRRRNAIKSSSNTFARLARKEFAPAAPYQPLYLLFIPVTWAAVRQGSPGSTMAVFEVTVGLTIAARLIQVPRGTMPRFQLTS
jgi:hypothetical protein